jgi:hypothetical protein
METPVKRPIARNNRGPRRQQRYGPGIFEAISQEPQNIFIPEDIWISSPSSNYVEDQDQIADVPW